MSTDQVVSRYPPEWLDAAWAAVRVKRRSFASDTSIANAVLAALEEVGALATAGEEWAIRTPAGVTAGWVDRGEAHKAQAIATFSAPLLRRWVGPWVEVPDA